MKKLIYILIFFVCMSFVSAMGNPAAAYCEHMGYELEFSFKEGDSKAYCVFNNENKCEEWSFFGGECGQEYVKDVPCRKIGESVFKDFEECCEGKGYLAPYTVGQSTCQPFSKRFVGNVRYNPLVWVGIVVILIVGYFVYKKYKK